MFLTSQGIDEMKLSLSQAVQVINKERENASTAKTIKRPMRQIH